MKQFLLGGPRCAARFPGGASQAGCRGPSSRNHRPDLCEPRRRTAAGSFRRQRNIAGARDPRSSRASNAGPRAHPRREAMSRASVTTRGAVVKESRGVTRLSFQLVSLAITLATGLGGRALAADQIDDALSNAGKVWYDKY